MSGMVLELGSLLLPGTSTAEGSHIAAAFHREIARLWESDRSAGIAWAETLEDLVLEVDPGLGGTDLGRAVARQVRDRARLGHRPGERA